MVSEQNLLHMYSLILDIRETANFDFPFPYASSYQAKSTLVLGDSQDAIMSMTYHQRRVCYKVDLESG